jgi:hypothetical protein
MGTKYSNTTVSGYNASPPPDDGSTTASNKINWATIKQKLSDPLNSFDTAINSALLNALDTSSNNITGTYATIASDNARTLQCSGTFTVSLGDAATMGQGWWCNIVNVGSGTITIGRATGGNTIAGVAANITLAPLQATTVIVNQANNGFNLTDCNSLIVDNTDPTKQVRFDASALTTGTTTALKVSVAQQIETQQGANIASASTINLDTATGSYVHVTGTTDITAVTLAQGRIRTVVFDGVLNLTNGASLILPPAGNIRTIAGDVAIFAGEAAGVVRCVSYQRAAPVAFLAKKTLTGASCIFTTEFDWSTFDYYEFVLYRAVPANNGAVIDCSLSEDAGSTYLGGTNYSYQATSTSSGGTTRTISGNSTNVFRFPEIAAQGISNSATNNGFNGRVTLWAPSSTLRKQMNLSDMSYFPGATDNSASGYGGAMVISTAAVTGIKFAPSTGNWTSGTISVFGHKAS